MLFAVITNFDKDKGNADKGTYLRFSDGLPSFRCHISDRIYKIHPEGCVLLGYCALSIGNFLPACRFLSLEDGTDRFSRNVGKK